MSFQKTVWDYHFVETQLQRQKRDQQRLEMERQHLEMEKHRLERELREFLPRCAKASPDNDTPEISLPADGKRYNAEEEQSNISKLPKRTAVRGQAIKSMIEKGYVSSRTATYNYVRKYEYQHSKFLWPMEHRYYNEMAKSFVAKEMLGLGYKGWFMQPNVMTSAKWKGSIVLKLSPIRFRDNMPCSLRNSQIDICSII